jgi:hypothetical protein
VRFASQGKLTVRHGKVNLRHVADDVLDLAAALAKPGVSVRNRIGAHIPQVRCARWALAHDGSGAGHHSLIQLAGGQAKKGRAPLGATVLPGWLAGSWAGGAPWH